MTEAQLDRIIAAIMSRVSAASGRAVFLDAIVLKQIIRKELES